MVDGRVCEEVGCLFRVVDTSSGSLRRAGEVLVTEWDVLLAHAGHRDDHEC
jgi:hypothetical protein